MPKKNLFVFLFFSLFALPFFCFINFIFEDYYTNAQKCIQAFDLNYRENCMWGSVETFKHSLNLTSERMQKSFFKIYCCSFFRNEGRRILSVNDPFSVEKSGEYVITMLNGNPLDKKSKAKTVKFFLWTEKESRKLFDEQDLTKQEIVTFTVKLEKGKKYSFVIAEIEPIPAYITLIVSDKPIID